MESMRDVNRVMEREIVKGSCPLTFEQMVFGEKPYQQILSVEKLEEVLSYLLRIGEYRKYAGKTINNNVYMDLDMLLRNTHFRRTHSIVERGEIFRRIQRYRSKLKPDYDGKLYLETVQCMFSLPEESREKYRMVYEGQETYGFLMSNQYMLGLFTHCEAARKSMAGDRAGYEQLPEKEQSLAQLEGVRNVLFQALLLDNVVLEQEMFRADLCTIMILE